jgi:hypothetical protein
MLSNETNVAANGVPASNAEYNGSGAHMTGSALVIDSAETYNKGKCLCTRLDSHISVLIKQNNVYEFNLL